MSSTDQERKQKQQGYLRGETLLQISGYQLLPGPDFPNSQILAIRTEDGVVALAMDVERMEMIGESLILAANDMRVQKGPES
jgi:hypothetical protein